MTPFRTCSVLFVFVKRCEISIYLWSSAQRDEALAAADHLLALLPLGQRPKSSAVPSFVFWCCFFLCPDRQIATSEELCTPSSLCPWHLDTTFFHLLLSFYLSIFLKPSSSIPLLPHPLFVSKMDSSGEMTSGQDGHLDLRSSPSRSDLSGLYHLGRTLGRGHFAVVKLARHVNTGQLVAVKMIDKTKLDVMATSHLLQEVR